MSLTNIQSLLRELDMRGALEQFNAYVNNPQELEATSIDTILTNMLTAEQNTRNKRRQESLIKASRLPVKAELCMILKDLERSDPTFINKIDSLSSLEFVEKC